MLISDRVRTTIRRSSALIVRASGHPTGHPYGSANACPLAAAFLRRCHWQLVGLALVAALLPSSQQLNAQLSLGRLPAAQDTIIAVSPVSPRAAMRDFLRLARAGDWIAAADYLAAPPADRDRAPVLARRLKTVMDQRLALDPEALSPLAVGDTADGDPSTDRVGVVLGVEGREEAILLVRRAGPPARWVFSQGTVANIDTWYESLGAPDWVRERVPASLMHEGPLSLYWWQWIGFLVALPLLVLAAWALGAVLRRLIIGFVRRSATTWDDELLQGVRGPFRLWAAAALVPTMSSALQFNPRVAGILDSVSRGLVLVAFFWALLQVVRLVQARFENAAWETGQGVQARTLVPLVGNLLRVVLVIVALLVALAEFGYPVGTLLAGLGIGGVALALAAQTTVGHLFGSVSLAADKVLRVGVWVKSGDTEGLVERVGLRSTSIRTLSRTVVRVPNGRLADDKVETFGERDRILFRTDIDLSYDTRRETLMKIRDGIEETLRANPQTWPDVVRVNVIAFTSLAVRMNVTAWIQTTDYTEFLRIRHDLLLEIMRIVESHDASFAFLSRAAHPTLESPGSTGLQLPPG